MSSRKRRPINSSIGVGSTYPTIIDLVRDKERIEEFAEAIGISRRNIRKDLCGQWTISGKGGHLQTWADPSSYLLYVAAYSGRKWKAIKRKARPFGWELTQDGDCEGCFCLALPDEPQSDLLRALLGLRRRRQCRPSALESVLADEMRSPLCPESDP